MGWYDDLRYSLRSHLRAPGPAAALVLTIALGAGVNATLFGYVGGLVTADVSAADPRLVDRFARVAVLLAAASALVFGLAGSTVAGLMLSRARGRATEMATRVALGARDGSLFRVCLTDVAGLVCAGGLAGGIAGWWTMFLFPMLFWAPDAEALVLAPRLSWVAGSSIAWVAVLVAAGTFPAFAEARRAPNRVLRRESAGMSAASVRRRRRIVAGEVAVACLLLVVASAIRQDLHATLRTVRGDALGSLLIVPLKAGNTLLPYIDAIEEAIHAVPGLSGWAFATSLPGSWPNVTTLAVEPMAARTREIQFDVSTFDVGAADPPALMPIAGRHFGFEDAPLGPRVAVVNDVAASRYFDDDAVGRIVEARGGTLVEIVGVLPAAADAGAARPELYYYVEQVHLSAPLAGEPFHVAPGGRRPRIDVDLVAVSEGYATLFGEPATEGRTIGAGDVDGAPRVAVVADSVDVGGPIDGAALIDEQGQRFAVVGRVSSEPLGVTQRAPLPFVRLALRQAPSWSVYLAVRSSEPAARVKSALDRAVGTAEGGRPMAAAITLEEHLVRTSLAAERIASALLGVVALVAMAIAVIGVSGSLADMVTRRRRELAVRLAFGAGRGQVIRTVVTAALRVAGTGLVAGAALSAMVLPVLGRSVAAPRMPDPATAVISAVSALLLVVAASALPAWRATRIQPREALG